MINWKKFSEAVKGELGYGDSYRVLGKRLDIAYPTVGRLVKGRVMVAETFMRACVEFGLNPMDYWEEES